MDLDNLIEEVLQFLHPNHKILRKGKRRQEAIWLNKELDYLPLLINNMPAGEKENYPSFNRREQFNDKRKMLMEGLWDLISTSRAKSDAQLSLPVDLGAGFIPSILGLKQRVFANKAPWLKESLSKEEIKEIEPDEIGDIHNKGLVGKAERYTGYFRRKLKNKAHVCLCGDMFWGPFSVAHLIRRDQIFTDFYRDPSFVHHLMKIATNLCIKSIETIKDAAGEPLRKGYRRDLYLGGGGVMSNEDTIVLISSSFFKKFVSPYVKRVFDAFDGGLIHFCGDGSHLLDDILAIPEIKGVNFGDPQNFDYEEVMQKILDRGKFYYGSWPRKNGESTESYFQRMLAPLKGDKKGLILTYELTQEEKKNPQRVIDLWHSLQE